MKKETKEESVDLKDDIIDVVDENDLVVGQEKKSLCHAKMLLHRGATVLIFEDNSYQKVLLQKRSRKKKSNPGQWCFVGGHLLAGDDYLTGAKRECQEEMFHNKPLPHIPFKELFKLKKDTDNDHEFQKVYHIVYPGPFFPDPEEVESFSFMKIDDLVRDIEKNPSRYTETTCLLTKKYLLRNFS